MIKIEVTGNSIPEVADKLLAIGASLQASAAVETPRGAIKGDAETGNAQKTARAAAATDSKPSTTTELATTFAEHAPKDAPSVTEPALNSASSAASTDTAADAPKASELSFETDVTPVVLAVVQTKGKPVVEEILSQFGVARASQLDPARWPELVAALKDQL
jgi:hypothetical protein